MKKVFFALAFCLLATIGCYGQKHEVFNFQSSEARTLDLSPSTFVHPLIAEVIVDTRVGRINDSWKLSASDFLARQIPGNSEAAYEATLQNLRAYGLFQSSVRHDCDLIVAATFDIKITNEGAVINIVGYPANFANWSTCTKEDFDWIMKEQEAKARQKSNNPNPNPEKK